ncbi:hypothetical protein HOY82DRAFT_666546 [Tuber indicum]|nr:hypothetical protein HOY82DRAFT_666546 [Tuber indicum]
MLTDGVLVARAQAARAEDNEAKEDGKEDGNQHGAEVDKITESALSNVPLPQTISTPLCMPSIAPQWLKPAHIWDLSLHYKSLESPGSATPMSTNKPTATLSTHRRLLGITAAMYSSPRDQDGGTRATDGSPVKGHMGVNTPDRIAHAKKHELSVDLSYSDVKPASRCRELSYPLVAGSDDGVCSVWDPRAFPNTPEGDHVSVTPSFVSHQQPIASVELHPRQDCIVPAASADSRITLLDLNIEMDNGESNDTGEVDDIPPQLMFIHSRKDD